MPSWAAALSARPAEVPAYFRPYPETPRCTCGRPATGTVCNGQNQPMVERCQRCGEAMAEQLNRPT
jgi:hypothetical protein